MDMRVGIVGAGGIAATHARALAALGIAPVITSTGPTAQRLAHQVGGTAVDTLDDLLARVDAVIIATPTPSHLSLGLAAIAAGVPIICEKPLARTATQAQQLADAAATAGLPLIPAHVVRWFPAPASIHEALGGAALSTLHLERIGAAPAPGSWFHDPAASGGVLLDLGIHEIDQAIWFAGPVAQVLAAAVGPLDATVELLHASGTTTRIRAAWESGRTGLSTRIVANGPAVELMFDGEPHGFSIPPVDDPYRHMLQDALTAIATGKPCRATTAEAIHAVDIAERALLLPGR